MLWVGRVEDVGELLKNYVLRQRLLKYEPTCPALALSAGGFGEEGKVFGMT